MDFIIQFILERAAYVDVEISRLATPTAIQTVSLSPSSLTFNKTIEYVPNPSYFNSPFITSSDFEQYYYLKDYTTRTLGNNATDWCSPVMSGYAYGSVILNPNGKTVRVACTYDDNDDVVVGTGYQNKTDKVLFVRSGNDEADIDATKCAIQLAGVTNANGLKVVNPKWITLDDSLIPSGTGDKYTGAIIEAQAGAIVLALFINGSGDTSKYYGGICTYASASDTTYISKLVDTQTRNKVVTISDANANYIGFKLKREMINNGGSIKYVVIPSEADLYSASETDWDAQTVTATFTPADATIDRVTWSVSDDSVVTISGNGRTATVNAVANGNTTITCTATDTTGLSASETANVTVTTS